MFSLIPQQFSAQAFPPLSPPLSMTHTVFDNGVEADISTIPHRSCVPRADYELLAASMRALRDAVHVPNGHVVVSVHEGVVVLDGRTSFYFERAAAECAVRFLDGVRAVENHILVEPPAER